MTHPRSQYLKAARDFHDPGREFRSSGAPLRQISLVKVTFQDAAASLFNEMPI
jgi:hypothetical protein